MNTPAPTDSNLIRYVLWVFGFTGSHRLTLGIFGIGLIYGFWTLNAQLSKLNLSRQIR